MRRNYVIILVAIVLTGCVEKNTNDPIEAFKYWAGEKPGNDVKVIKAQYWESSHWMQPRSSKYGDVITPNTGRIVLWII